MKPFILAVMLLAPGVGFCSHSHAISDLGEESLSNAIGMQESDLRNAFLNSLYTSKKVSDNAYAIDFIRGIGNKILSKNRISTPIEFYVIEDESINAFAGPTGVIAVHTGLIKAAKTEDEIAAVIAHEISHVIQSHLVRGFRDGELSVGEAALIGLSVAVGTMNPELGMAGYTAMTAKKLEGELESSRGFEYEADHVGIKLLHASGYSPFAMATFFDTLYKHYGSQNSELEFLMSHPVTESRLAKAMDRAESFPKKDYVENVINHEVILSDELKVSDSNLDTLLFEQELSPSKVAPALKTALKIEVEVGLKAAEEFLAKKLEKVSYRYLITKKLAQLNNSLGNTGRAYYFEALTSLEKGDQDRYFLLLRNAKKFPLDNTTTALINVALDGNKPLSIKS